VSRGKRCLGNREDGGGVVGVSGGERGGREEVGRENTDTRELR